MKKRMMGKPRQFNHYIDEFDFECDESDI